RKTPARLGSPPATDLPVLADGESLLARRSATAKARQEALLTGRMAPVQAQNLVEGGTGSDFLLNESSGESSTRLGVVEVDTGSQSLLQNVPSPFERTTFAVRKSVQIDGGQGVLDVAKRA